MSPTTRPIWLSLRPRSFAIARELVRSARALGVAMTGLVGMLKALTRTVIVTALREEMTEHLGYDKHEGAGTPTTGSGQRRC